MERGDDQQHSETDCMTTGPAVASGDPGATVEELKRQIAALDGERVDSLFDWLFNQQMANLASQFDGVDLEVFDGGE
jgi:hypothetical protein